MEKDREGIWKRVLAAHRTRTDLGHYSEDKLVFQADIVAETDEVMYLEGIYVNSEDRGKGIGTGLSYHN